MRRILWALAITLGLAAPAMAQQPGSDPTKPLLKEGWSFNVAPYLWTPWIDTTVNYRMPQLAAMLPTTANVSFSDYIGNMHFAGMLAGEARNGRMSVVTDVIYMNLVSSNFDTRHKSIDIRNRPRLPLSSTSSIGSQTSLNTTVWTLAGGYTVLDGEWGNVDIIAGFRYLGFNSSTNFNLGVNVTGPVGGSNVFLGRGAANASEGIWNGVGGLRGKFKFTGSGWYIPYYFDIGAGGSDITWQISAGVGYQRGLIGAALLYRYLSFQQPSSNQLRQLNLGGPMAMINFSF